MGIFACETCGAAIPEGKNKCEYCGSVYVFDKKTDSLIIEGIRCDSCNEINPAKTNFCLNCGNKLIQKCSSCGFKFSKFSNHCPSCGKFIKIDTRKVSNSVSIEDFFTYIQNSDYIKADRTYTALEKHYSEDRNFLSSSIYFYTKWGMSFDADPTMSNYSRKYRNQAKSIISSLDENFSDSKEITDAVNYYYKNESIKEDKKKKEGCFIATEIYGSYTSPQVMVLRYWRDETLLKSFLGKIFVHFYYFISPKILFAFRAKMIRNFTEKILNRFVNFLSKMDNYN